MAVTVKIPTQLRPVTGGDSEAAVEDATTVGEELDGLYDRYDGLRDRIAEDGDLRRFANGYGAGEGTPFPRGAPTTPADAHAVTPPTAAPRGPRPASPAPAPAPGPRA